MTPNDLERYFANTDDLARRLLPVCQHYSPEAFERLVHLITIRNLRFELPSERYVALVSRLGGLTDVGRDRGPAPPRPHTPPVGS